MGLEDGPLALTLGDPAGIGPDISLLAFAARKREAIPPFVLLGDAAVLAARARDSRPRRADRRGRRRRRSAGPVPRRPPRAAGEGRPARSRPAGPDKCRRARHRGVDRARGGSCAARRGARRRDQPDLQGGALRRRLRFRGIRNISPPSPRPKDATLHPVMMLASARAESGAGQPSTSRSRTCRAF